MQKRVRAGLLVGCLVVALLAFMGCASSNETKQEEKFDIASESGPTAIIGAMGNEVSLEATGVKNILLIGDDEWETYTPGHADMMLLLKVDFDNHTIYEVSVPRDTRWQFNEETAGKLNYVYTVEGAAAQTRAAAEIIGEPIDFYAAINFEGLEAIVEHFGGLMVDLPYDIEYSFYTEDYPNEVFEAGEQTLTPWRAMAIARARTGYDPMHQDYVRQYVVRQMMTSLMRAAYGSSEGIPALFTLFQNDIESNIPLNTQISWAEALGSTGSVKVIGLSGPNEGDIDSTAQDQWVVTPDPDGWTAVMASIKNGTDIEATMRSSYLLTAHLDEVPVVTETTIAVK